MTRIETRGLFILIGICGSLVFGAWLGMLLMAHAPWWAILALVIGVVANGIAALLDDR